MNDRLQYIINCREGAGVGTLLFKSKLIVFLESESQFAQKNRGKRQRIQKGTPLGSFLCLNSRFIQGHSLHVHLTIYTKEFK